MEITLSLLPALAPLGLILVSIAARTRFSPSGIQRFAEVVAGLGLGLALLTGGVVLALGSQTSPMLGIDGLGLSLRLDWLSATMFAVVSFVGLLVVRYSRSYLAGDPRHGEFVGRLSLALAAVTLLVLAGNLAQLVVAWMAASFALHRLLVFFPDRPRAVIAGRKKMIAARLGDVFLIAAAVLLAQGFGTTDIATIAREASSLAAFPSGLAVATWLLVAAALLKSAQVPFHAWLPEVMETPTPVSALLHAGLINSGGFLILRFADLVVLESGAMTALVAVGMTTAVFGSLVMLTQTTIKGSLAYSTLAQMGFMMLECGLGAFGIAILHIVGHSLYKAHAFLSAGDAVIHAPAAASPQPLGRLGAGFAVAAGGLAAIGLTTLFVAPSEPDWTATAALACIFGFGIVIWAGKQLEGRRQPAAVAAALGTVLVAPALFVAMKGGVSWLYGAELAMAPSPSAAAQAVVVLGLGAMASLAWLQLVGFPVGSLSQRAYVSIRNGAYFGAMWDRFSGALHVRSTRGSDDLGSAEPCVRVYTPGPSGMAPSHPAPDHDEIAAALERAARAVPPLWPLSDFVAVNPFLGQLDRTFEDASTWLERSAGARTTMPRSFYAAAMDSGDITREDVEAAVAAGSPKVTVESVERGARKQDRAIFAAPTVADVARGIMEIDLPRLVVERIGDWAGSHFDCGQARWPSPFRDASPYAAWRAYAMLDRSPEMLGLASVRSYAEQLPECADEAISVCVERLGLAENELDLYFQRLLMRVAGWAGHVRWTGWSAELAGKPPQGLDQLLAIALAWEAALLEADPRVANAWHIARSELSTAVVPDPEREIDLTLHHAFEIANRRQLSERLSGAAPVSQGPADAQVVFCIDVRSERVRRALEASAPATQTLGFAGFFGMAVEWIPLGEERGVASCPVLLEPAHAVRETSADADARIARSRFRRGMARAFGAFKTAAVSSFGFVEALGLAYAVKLLKDGLGLGGPAHREVSGTQPSFDLKPLGRRVLGIALDDRVDLAEGALRGMSLTDGFAPLVVLTGHRSTTANNPFAAGLDCGACGGRTGEPNARVAAAILNDPEVRSELLGRGIRIPEETRFLAAVHDTTTDLVSICDRDTIPRLYARRVEALEAALARAGEMARLERTFSLGVEDGDEQQIFARARDWAQVRPEWGLAGCTSFIVGPRHYTAGAELGTSAFLHEYDWTADEGFDVLELIMTAPMVVASWINLQYFASTVDNRAFGAGDKVLHNVAGGLGVVEGNGGDLRVGLPMQSVHDGQRFVHRASRLTVAIAAPIDAINGVIASHAMLTDLLDHGWIHLVALNDAGEISHRYEGALEWSELGSATDEVAA